MAVLETIAGAVAKAAADRIFARSTSDTKSQAAERRLQKSLKDHLREVANWTAKIHTLDAAGPKETQSSTIALAFSAEPRKLLSQRSRTLVKQETDLLADDDHCVILGNPGSGKTTTIKRLARRLLLEPPVTSGDGFQFPVVVRLRELGNATGVHMALATSLVGWAAMHLFYRLIRSEGSIPDIALQFGKMKGVIRSIARVVALVPNNERRKFTRSDRCAETT